METSLELAGCELEGREPPGRARARTGTAAFCAEEETLLAFTGTLDRACILSADCIPGAVTLPIGIFVRSSLLSIPHTTGIYALSAPDRSPH